MNAPAACAGENLALQGRASQSTLYQFGAASNAIDGNRDSNWEHGSCSHTSNDISPWWRLDLRKTHRVFSVNVTNIDTDPERLDGAEIRIGDSLENNGNDNPRYDTRKIGGKRGDKDVCEGSQRGVIKLLDWCPVRCAVIPQIRAGLSAGFQCGGVDGMDGRYVSIVLTDREEFLTLCEVEVYGSRLDY